MWTVKIELLRPINLDHDIVVERARIFLSHTIVDVLTVVNDLFQARNSYSLSFLTVETTLLARYNSAMR